MEQTAGAVSISSAESYLDRVLRKGALEQLAPADALPPSALAQLIGQSAGARQLCVEVRDRSGVTRPTQRRNSKADLLDPGLRHGGVAEPLRERHESHTLPGRTHRPVERHAFAGPFHERRAKGDDRLLEPLGAALSLAERCECDAQI